MNSPQHASAAAALWRMTGGLWVWALHFAVVYGSTALACARGVPGAAPVIAITATALAVAVLLWLLRAAWRQWGGFEAAFGAGMAGFALLAVVWEAMPVLWVPACVGR